MYRCLAAAVAAVSLVGAASAQSLRAFPADALRGEIVVGQSPNVQLNGQAARLGAGARLRGPDNLVRMPASLIGQKFLVHYTVDPQGLLREVWILSEAEAARKPWPATREEAASWRFDAIAQTWFKP